MVHHEPFTVPHTGLPLRATWRLPRSVRPSPSTLGGVLTRLACLLCSLLFIWFVWFYRFIEFAARIKRENQADQTVSSLTFASGHPSGRRS